MKTIDITLASPAVAVIVEEALRLRAAERPEYPGQTLLQVADAIKTARLRVEFRHAGDRFFGKVAP